MRFRICATLLLIAFSICMGFSQNKIYVDVDAGSGGDGSSWAMAYDDLQDALAEAEATTMQDDTIWVAEGIYYPDDTDRSLSFDIPHTTYLYGGFEGDEEELSERDVADNETILSGDIDQDDDTNNHNADNPDLTGNSKTVVYMKLLCLYSLVDGFTISGGVADSGVGRSINGGGVYIDGGSTNGGIPVFRNNTFRNNFSNKFGGAIYADGKVGGYAHYAVGNCIFEDNKAISNGGAIQNDGQSSPLIVHATFTSNTAAFGGAIYNNGADRICSPTIVNCTFNNNTVNSASGSGGAVFSFASGSGGTSSPQFVNCLIYDNFSSGSAPGLYSLSDNSGVSEMQITNCTFYNNNSNIPDNGGHVYVNESNSSTGIATIRNSIIWGSNDNPPNFFVPHLNMSGVGVSSPEIDIDFSLVDADSCADLLPSGSVGTLTCGANLLFENPISGGTNSPDFVDEAGRDFRLTSTSSALDVGDETFLPIDALDFDMDMDSMELLPVDLDWNHRVIESAVGEPEDIDFGPYEFNSIPALPQGAALPDDYTPLSPPEEALPVELLSFTARPEAGKVDIQWVTLTEDNNDYFIVERSSNGVDFEMIHREEGAGTSALARTYQVSDNNPFAGKSYYRLKQVDFDGRFEYSDIRVVDISEDGQLKTFPNPVANTLNVELSGFKVREVSFEIYHLSGKMMHSGSSSVNEGIVVIELDGVEKLLPGSYIIRIENEKGADLFGKFLKVRL